MGAVITITPTGDGMMDKESMGKDMKGMPLSKDKLKKELLEYLKVREEFLKWKKENDSTEDEE